MYVCMNVRISDVPPQGANAEPEPRGAGPDSTCAERTRVHVRTALPPTYPSIHPSFYPSIRARTDALDAHGPVAIWCEPLVCARANADRLIPQPDIVLKAIHIMSLGRDDGAGRLELLSDRFHRERQIVPSPPGAHQANAVILVNLHGGVRQRDPRAMQLVCRRLSLNTITTPLVASHYTIPSHVFPRVPAGCPPARIDLPTMLRTCIHPSIQTLSVRYVHI